MTTARLGVLLFGILLLVSGVGTLSEDVHIVQTGLRTTGVVVANEFHSTGRTGTRYRR
jgi:hypothetical protein